MRIIDISPLISPKIAVFPGDQKYENPIAMDFAKGDHLKVSSLKSTTHLGAHADAPNHYHATGAGIDQADLLVYLGTAQVIQLQLAAGARIYPNDFAKIPITAKRVLFRTDSFADPNTWKNDFNSLSPETIDYLNTKGVVLVGIDTPSVDPSESKKLESHQALHRTKMAVLEGLLMTDAEPGNYWLVALPLKLAGCDASPVRAVLLDHDPQAGL